MEGSTATKVAIEKITGVNVGGNMNPWIKLWEAAGIVDTGSNPAKATFSLSELGVAPAPPKVDQAKSAAK